MLWHLFNLKLHFSYCIFFRLQIFLLIEQQIFSFISNWRLNNKKQIRECTSYLWRRKMIVTISLILNVTLLFKLTKYKIAPFFLFIYEFVVRHGTQNMFQNNPWNGKNGEKKVIIRLSSLNSHVCPILTKNDSRTEKNMT